MVQFVRPWSRSDMSNAELPYEVVYSVSLSEKVKNMKNDCDFFNFLLLRRRNVFLSFLLVWRKPPLVIELSSDNFGDNSFSNGRVSISLSSFSSTLFLLFLFPARPMGSVGSFASARCLFFSH